MAGRFEVEVTDTGRPQGFGLAVIAELADDVQIQRDLRGDQHPDELAVGRASGLTGLTPRFEQVVTA